MEISEIPVKDYQRVARAVDPDSGLHAFIAVHDTTLGASLGGLRMWPYENEGEALLDAKRLARGMTYKSAIARTGVGGGKAVIWGDPKVVKSEQLYLAMGRFIDAFDGAYITAEDVNTTIADLEMIRRATTRVTGLSPEMGGSGNPSPLTAHGVFLGIGAALQWVHGDADLQGRRVAVQGVGAVGSALVQELVAAGAEVLVADKRAESVEAVVREFGVTPVTDREIYSLELDVFAPCALGAVINDDTVPKLRCKIVAGSANNVLLDPRHGLALRERGILYAPDYVINAGGIINVSAELLEGGYDRDTVMERVARIPQSLEQLWTIARAREIPTSDAADCLAEEILCAARMARG